MVRGELMKVMWLRSTWIMLAVLMGGTAALSLFNLAIQNAHNVSLCHKPPSRKELPPSKTVPHLSILRLEGLFLNAGPPSY